MSGMEHYKKNMGKAEANSVERTAYGSDDFGKSGFERLNDSLGISDALIAEKEGGLKKVETAIAIMEGRLKNAQAAQVVHAQGAFGRQDEFYTANFDEADADVRDVSHRLEGLHALRRLQERVIADLKARRSAIEQEKDGLVKTAYLKEDGFPKWGTN